MTPVEHVTVALRGFSDKRVAVGQSIHPRKLAKARKSFAPDADGAALLYDNTIFGSNGDGLLIASQGVYWREHRWKKPVALPWSQIRGASVEENTVVVKLKDGEARFLCSMHSTSMVEVAQAISQAIASVVAGA